jgi:hypothetical protein
LETAQENDLEVGLGSNEVQKLPDSLRAEITKCHSPEIGLKNGPSKKEPQSDEYWTGNIRSPRTVHVASNHFRQPGGPTHPSQSASQITDGHKLQQ